MSNALLYRMASGIPGDISRRQFTVVDSAIADAAKPFAAYGRFGKMVAGKFQPLESGDAVGVIAGLLARPYPTQTSAGDGTGISSSPILDRVLRGFMTVKNNAGVAAIDGQVYARVAGADSTHPLGGIEAADSHTNVGAATGGNTGNGTIGTISVDSTAESGAYVLTMLTATTYRVVTPSGVRLKDGATGTAYTAGGLTATITVGGTPMVAGDSFTVTVVRNTVAVPGAKFTCAADASGNVEIQYNV